MCVSAQRKYSAMCVMHKQDKFCGWNGSANSFSCRYTANLKEISMTGWSFTLEPDKLKYQALRNKCMLKTAELESCSASMSYFTKAVAQPQSDCTLCAGLRQKRFHVLASPVSIVVERLIQEHDVMIASWTVTTGQRIRLTCAPACTSNPGPDRGYIWYKDSVRLPASGAGSSRVLRLDTVSHKHQGSYVCASVGHEISPSSPVNLTVLAATRPIHLGPSPTEHPPAEDPSRGWSSVSLFCTVLVVGVCVGLVVVTAVGIVARRKRRTKEGRQRKDSVPSDSGGQVYASLDVRSQSPTLYETVGNVQRCAAAFMSSDYENLNGCGMKDNDWKAVAGTDHRVAARDARSRTPESERPSPVW